MTRWMPLAVATLLAACVATPQPQPLLPADHNGPPELPPAMPQPPAADSISTERMSEIVRVLASDAFQGRAPGTAGEDKTVNYLIQQFRMAGLEPGGENGSWTQMVPMIRTKLMEPFEFRLRHGTSDVALSFPKDI
ncbi:MAG TPA: hypothetical protein VF027_07025, partial [Sphingomicrobium sp.]